MYGEKIFVIQKSEEIRGNKRRKIMAGVRTSLTEAQMESRKNHYLEKVGKGKPKAKGTKSNPLKNEDLARMLKERFGKKNKGNVTKAKGSSDAIATLNQQAETAAKNQKINASKTEIATPKKPLTYSEAHQLQNMISDESLENLNKAKSKLEAEEAAKNEKVTTSKTETPATKKSSSEPKTWNNYANKHGKKYTAPKSGVLEADRRAAEIIKRNEEAAKALRQEALYNAERINKPFSTSAQQIDKQLGLGHKYAVSPNYAKEYEQLLNQQALQNAEKISKPFSTSAEQIDKNLGIGKKNYPVSPNYAEEYGKLLDEKYGPKGGSKPVIPTGATGSSLGNTTTNVAEAAEKGKAGTKQAIKDSAKKPGFFARIGNALKGKKGKIALAAGAIALVAGLVSYCSGKKDKDNVKPDMVVTPTPVNPEPKPKESKYDVCYEEGQMPKSYTIKAGDYPSAIITSTYGVKYGTPEYKAIKEAVYEASEYKPNTNIYEGDKFTLPDVEVNGKVYSANPDAEVKPGRIADNGLKLAHTKEVVKENDKYYIIYKETGEKDPNEPAFDSVDATKARIGELDAQEEEQK